MSNFITSLIRTYVPIGVGAVISYFATLGLEIDADTQLQLVLALTAVIQAAYYFIARKLEKKYPQLGFLLGTGAQPTYKQ